MIPLIDQVEAQVQKAIQKAFPDLPLADTAPQVTLATQRAFGHYQSNAAMSLAKKVGKAPRGVAEAIVREMETDSFASIEVAGPGFINLTLRPSFLSSLLEARLLDPRLGIPRPRKPQRIIVEFSSPNVAKEMHVGHLRSTIIGDVLARLFEFLGHDVLRLNHIGDWGTAFGMLIAYMEAECPEALEGGVESDLPTLMSWYRAAKVRFDEEEEFKRRARLLVVALQGGDPKALRGWKTICDVSLQAFQQIYDLLDVRLHTRGESFYNPLLSEVVEDLEEKGLVTLSEGAKCVFHEGYEIPLMIQKSDGGYNYDTTDMAAMLHRIEDEKADRIIIVTDAGQSLHFALVRKTAEKAGYLDPKKVRFDHVTFGVVLGADGKKFRTRSGEVERLIDLLTRAIAEAKKIVVERNPEIAPAEAEELAHVLGIDAVKYGDLSCNRVGDYEFSYERMLRFEGNTALFLLYAYVRVKGIQRKVGAVEVKKLLKRGSIAIEHPSEEELALHLLRFAEILRIMEETLFPNVLTDYLYLLAQKFHAFFRDCRVEGTAHQTSRLLLCELVKRTMERGFSLLGLRTVDRL